MAGSINCFLLIAACYLITGIFDSAVAQERVGGLVLQEKNGLNRELEYIEFSLQVAAENIEDQNYSFVAERISDKHRVHCQVIEQKMFEEQNIYQFRLVFPVSIKAYQSRAFDIKVVNESNSPETDISFTGKGYELTIDNMYYRADLTKSNKSVGKSHESGQLNELLIKMGFDVLLLRSQNRMHWAPNFHNPRLEYYKTIAAWERPKEYLFIKGPYLIRTMRSDKAPEHTEIQLSASYSFFAGLPYFTFYSSMIIEKDVTLFLLRNDEMTMDSLFTHIAFKKKSGEIVDLSFNDRYKILDAEPIDNEAPWLCFYNSEKGYAFGSVRIKYDITNDHGYPSPTYHPHTKISDGANGGKYWNRRLIHDHTVRVEDGSRYVEENAYIVFKINKAEKFAEIIQWAEKIRNPLQVFVEYTN